MSYVYNYVLLLGEDDEHNVELPRDQPIGIVKLNRLVCARRFENDGFIDASEHFRGSKVMEAGVWICGQNGVSPDEILAMIANIDWHQRDRLVLLCKEQESHWRLIMGDINWLTLSR